MTWAYTSCNVGVVSNEITRVWSSDQEIDLDLVKFLTLYNNLVIDAAKNLYLPKKPEDILQRLAPYTKSKVPHFFMEAKQKSRKQVASIIRREALRPKGWARQRAWAIGGSPQRTFTDYNPPPSGQTILGLAVKR